MVREPPTPLRHLRAAGVRLALGCLVAALALAGCGGSSKKAPAHAKATTTTTKHAPSSTAAGQPSDAVTTGPVHAFLHAANHSPTAGKLWPYSVRVTDPSGRPLSGTVRAEFTFGGIVVGTDHPPVHRLRNGRWHERLTFPAAAVGHPLIFQVVVTTPAGSVTLGWPVQVRR